MKVLVVGTGAVGAAVAAVARRRDFFERITFADLDPARPAAVVERDGDDRFAAAQVDAGDREALVALLRETGADAVLNAADPRFNPPILDAAFEYGCTYLDMAMTLSGPDVLLGQDELDAHERWQERGLLALAGIGVEPGLADVFARYAADHLFDEIDEVGVRDGADLVVEGYDFAPTFSIWTTIEECLNPPLIWEKERGFFTTEPFSEPELFEFPEGIGVIECVNVEHEEVVLVPREIDCRRVTFKYGLGAEFIDVLQTLHKLGLDSTEPVRVRGVDVAPRDVVAAALPDPATLGDRMRGKTCAGTLVTGKRKDGGEGAVYLYHVSDNERTMREYGHQAVVLQTALNPVVALELLAAGTWQGTGVLGPESFPPEPFLELLADYGEPHGVVEGDPRRPSCRARTSAAPETPLQPIAARLGSCSLSALEGERGRGRLRRSHEGVRGRHQGRRLARPRYRRRRVRGPRRPFGVRQDDRAADGRGAGGDLRRRVRIGDRVVNHVPSRDRDIAMVFQSYALYPHLSVYDNIAFGLRVKKMPKQEIDRRVRRPPRSWGSSRS